MERPNTDLLSKCQQPQILKSLDPKELISLCEELRYCLVETLNEIGGHFAGSLGVVELTVALHYIFDTPDDRLIWDVGHQTYIHKMLTGRLKSLKSIRKTGGLSGFPSRFESEYDTFGVGHSSTSISAALGMSLASAQQGHHRRVVAIIGDGSLTAGMAFEALNHAGAAKANILVILNDNGMSIAPNVGALSKTMREYEASPFYENVLSQGKKLLKILPSSFQTMARQTKQHVKELLQPGSFFRELGFSYSGPIDGHNINDLLSQLALLKDQKGPHLLHVLTKKGKGYAAAEADPVKYHAVSTGFLNPSSNISTSRPTYSDVFGQWICDMAQNDSRLVAITAATGEGSGLYKFSKKFPHRYYDVGIAEQHSITFAAGLACEGLKPVVAIYSTFLQRAYDQLIHDVALQNLPVLFAIDRSGLVGADGPTHAGSFDLSYLRCIPNLIIMTPSDENECRQMLYTGFLQPMPVAVRYPRGIGSGVDVQLAMQSIPIGQSEILREGHKIAFLVFGTLLPVAQRIAEEIGASVVNMRFVKPLDTQMIQECAKTHELLVTLEENVIKGGAGSGVNEYLHRIGSKCSVYNFGLPDQFLPHGHSEEQLAWSNLTAESILHTLTSLYPKLIHKNLIFLTNKKKSKAARR